MQSLALLLWAASWSCQASAAEAETNIEQNGWQQVAATKIPAGRVYKKKVQSSSPPAACCQSHDSKASNRRLEVEQTSQTHRGTAWESPLYATDAVGFALFFIAFFSCCCCSVCWYHSIKHHSGLIRAWRDQGLSSCISETCITARHLLISSPLCRRCCLRRYRVQAEVYPEELHSEHVQPQEDDRPERQYRQTVVMAFQKAPVDKEGILSDCAICLEPFLEGEQVRTLPCRHLYHTTCVDPWLAKKLQCPVCKRRMDGGG